MTASDTDSESIEPSLGAEQLRATVPRLEQLARVTTRSLVSVGSPSLTIADVLTALRFAERQVQSGASGVVLTQGTDTLEETAYLLDLLWKYESPLVLTGAMRSPSQLGSDGAMNLQDAVITAIDPRVRGLGALVAMTGDVHAARYATKSHSIALSAFSSPDAGPLGSVVEGRLSLRTIPPGRPTPLPPPKSTEVGVPIIEMGLADDGVLLTAALSKRPAAIVLAAAGAGHVPQVALPACERVIETGTPLIFGTRAGAGGSLTSTYGYPGAEEDLIRRGAISSGILPPRKARLLAFLLTQSGADTEQIRREFENRQGFA